MHADRAGELTGEKVRKVLEERGIMVTSTAGTDSNANGRAERACRWIKDRTRTLLVTNIRNETYQSHYKTRWTFAAQHAAEIHRREAFGLPVSKFEFGQRV